MIAITIAFVVSCALTELIRRYCVRKGIVDVPNQRSSHDRIVARGGGLGFSAVFLAAVVLFGAFGTVPWYTAIGFFGGGCVIAGTGWVDDQRGLTQVTRIVLHLLAAAWAVAWIGPVPAMVPGSAVWKWVSQGLGVAAIAWMVNLYNFMDGTDGIAAVEAVTVAILSGALCAVAGIGAAVPVYGVAAAAVAGFLVWNWPPARIFMGDAGSGFLGFTFATFALWCATEEIRLLWPCTILLSLFIADATTTLFRRMANGERWYEPHRSHAYQKIARRCGHLPVAAGVAAINVLVLGPVAWMAWMHPGQGFALALGVNVVLAGCVLGIRERAI